MRDDAVGGLVIAGFIGLIGLLGYAMVQEQKQWDTFKIEHHCIVIGKEEGGIAPVVTGKGTGAAILPDKTTYKCDDGMQYTRED